MSESNTGFDWFSVLAILVAGGISIVKAMSNKSKQKAGIPPQHHPEYQKEYDEEAGDRSEVVGGYDNIEFKEQEADKLALEGDYYSMPSEISAKEDIVQTQDDGEDHEQRHINIDFDLRQAVISSEILRRPQY